MPGNTAGLDNDITINAVRYVLAQNAEGERPGLAWWREEHTEDEPGELGETVLLTWDDWSGGMGLNRRYVEEPASRRYLYTERMDCSTPGRVRLPPRKIRLTSTSLAMADNQAFLFQAAGTWATTTYYIYLLNNGVSYKFFVETDNSITYVEQEAPAGTGSNIGRPAIYDGKFYVPFGYSTALFRELTSINAHLTYKLFTYDAGAPAWTDNTTEARSAAGTPFNIVNNGAVGDIAYFAATADGSTSVKFDALYINLATLGVGGTLVWEYWNGAWVALTVVDGTSVLTQDGEVTWTAPSDWVATTINTVSALWVRARVSVLFTTVPTCLQATPVDKWTAADATLTSLAHATIQDGSTSKLGRGYSTNLVALASTAPLTAGSWGSGFEVGNTSARITDMVDTGVAVYVAKEDNLFRFEATGAAYSLFNIMLNTLDPRATVTAIPGTEMAIYNHLTGLYVVTGDLVQRLGLETLLENLPLANINREPYRGQHWEHALVGNWLYIIYDVSGGGAERSYLMVGYVLPGPRIVWHTLDMEETGATGTFCRGIHPDNSSRLWQAGQDKTASDDFVQYRRLAWDGAPDAGSRSLGRGAASTQHRIFFEEIAFRANVELHRVEVETLGLSANAPLQIQVIRDGGSVENVGATITGNGISKRYWTAGTNDQAVAARLVLDITTLAGYSSTDDTVDPTILSVNLEVLPLPDTADVYRWTIDCATTVDRGFVSDAKTIRDNLDALKGGTSVTCVDPDGNTLALNINQVKDLGTIPGDDGNVHYLIECTGRERVTS